MGAATAMLAIATMVATVAVVLAYEAGVVQPGQPR
jgi:hypothetical protein